MKTILSLLLAGMFVITQTSCVHRTTIITTNNGKHKGWSKNPNNPHHPKTTNPGHTKKKGKK